MKKEMKRISLSFVLILGVLFSVVTPSLTASAKTTQRESNCESIRLKAELSANDFDLEYIKEEANSVDKKSLKNASELKTDTECLSVDKQLKNFSENKIQFSKNTDVFSTKNVKTVYNNKITADSETQNTSPIADLKYVILNSDSLINGNITTETQIGWLWSYNGQDFTYDPDGDAIVKKNVGGIPNDSITGTFNDGSGFVTQFNTAAQYIMTFQVEDARGALSNVFSIVISVEPADENTRPVCNIQYLYDNFDTDQVEAISWKDSTDDDDSDTITDLGFYITGEDGTKLVQNEDFAAVIVDDDTLGIQFAESGNYRIWLRVVDQHNAWSDWVILTVTVSSPNVTITDLTISNSYHSDYDPIAENDAIQHWIDYQKSMELAQKVGSSDEDAQWVFKQVKSKQFPEELSKHTLGFGFVVKGTLIHREDSTPKANAPVRIYLPVTNGHSIDTTVYTDSDGKFEFNCSGVDEYFSALGYDTSDVLLGDYSGTDTKYAYYNSRYYYTIFYYLTKLTISSGNDQYQESVSAAAGAIVNGTKRNIYAVLGNRWVLTSVTGDCVLRWVENPKLWR